MKPKCLERVKALQFEPTQIRNICILAHVDHGKTTLADSLVASNGIISKRNSGKIRYLDSRLDEQERGITMKSSAISLLYEQESKDDKSQQECLINLIDSPGHVDFSSEVSTAVRLCDGAIVLVDVVEGVCPQTQAVLRQAWLENIRPVLVLNKIDRLILQLKLSPTEAYLKLIQILEQVNLITNRLFTSEAMEKTSQDSFVPKGIREENTETTIYDWTIVGEEDEHKNIYFSPEQGNVIFASAYDGWGFKINKFASMYASKVGMNESVLQRTLWGDFYMNVKAKRIMKGAQSKGKKPLFVQLVLDNIWAVYSSIVEQKDQTEMDKIIKSLGLFMKPRETQLKDTRLVLQNIMSQWLPLANILLDTVIEHTPSPVNMLEERAEKLMCSVNRQFSSFHEKTRLLKTDFQACSSMENAPTIVYISKMFPIEKQFLPQNKIRALTEEELKQKRAEAIQRHAERARKKEEAELAPTSSTESSRIEEAEEELDHVFVAFARVFSGTVRKGDKMYFLGPKHDPNEALHDLEDISMEEFEENTELQAKYPHLRVVVLQDLYLLMGRELESLDAVPAGNVFGIGGLQDDVLKSGTLSSTALCPAFTDMYFDVSPIVRVAVEPVNAGDMSKLVTGLKLLNQADPCVEVRVQETGEHVIISSGEVHLQRCIDDLITRFGKVEINISTPIVPFRETVVLPPTTDMVNENIDEQNTGKEEEQDSNGTIQASTADRQAHLMLRASPLPGRIADILLNHSNTLELIGRLASNKSESTSQYQMDASTLEHVNNIKQELKEEFIKAGEEWTGAENQIWCFGPRRCGPNILLNRIASYNRPSIWENLDSEKSSKLDEFDNSLESGFQIASLAGPLCEEPMHGVCFIVEDWWYGSKKGPLQVNCDNVCEINAKESESKPSSRECGIRGREQVQRQSATYGPLSGQLISTVKDGCRRAFQAQPQRLMTAMYKCQVQATVEVLGKLHAILSKRLGQVLSEEMIEGSDIFIVDAVLPVIESFGFTEEIRKKTSGLASPQLKFSHWETVTVDPFWVPTTEEEYMHFGEKADAENKARIYMNKVRKRKGLRTDEKLVEFGEKQRTLTKMK